MAIAAATVFEVRTGGSDTLCSGGFVTGASGTDRSQQNAAHATLGTSSVVHTTTTQVNVHAGDYTVQDPEDVGNLLIITGGTATAGLYQITAADEANNRWTLDRAAGTAGQTIVGAMGGAFASPGKAAAVATVSGNRIWVKAGTYTLTTSTPGAAGPVLFASAINVIMQGYSATRGDYAGRPEVNAGAITSIIMFRGQGNAKQAFVHMRADGNGGASVTGFNLDNIRWFAIDCESEDCVIGFDGNAGAGGVIGCHAINSSSSGFRATHATVGCSATSCNPGFEGGSGGHMDCLAYSNDGDGFSVSGNGGGVYTCTSDSNTGDGFELGGSGQKILADCLSTNNSGWGYRDSATCILEHCASFNNASGRISAANSTDNNGITVTADPYVNQAGADFRLNYQNSGGKLLRSLAYTVGDFAEGRDVGAVQSEDDIFPQGYTCEPTRFPDRRKEHRAVPYY